MLSYASRWTLAAVSVFCCSLAPAQFQAPPPWTDRWEAHEQMIPMRDGVKLYTVYYIPKDKTGPFPILMERTPYGAGSPEDPPRRSGGKLGASGYIFAFQDVRGANKSEGVYENVRPTLPKGRSGIDESTDTYDTVDWLIKNVSKNSGRVGLWGISYPGFYAGAGAIRNHPALKAVSPQAPVNDWFMGDDVQHRGAFYLQETFDFSSGFDVPRGGERPEFDRGNKPAYDFFLSGGALSNFDAKFYKGKIPYWKELMANDTYNPYWKERALWRSFNDVTCAVLTVGGWFDKEDQYGALQLYKAGEKQNPKSANFLVMGPWSHGGWAGGGGASLGDLEFGSATSRWYQDNVEAPFFEKYLKGIESVAAPADATMFETGANEWRTFPTWPPAGLKKQSLYLGAKKTAAWTKEASSGSLSYVYDPAAPTPYLADWQTSRYAPGDWLARDQSFLDGRKDNEAFRSQPLAEDLRIAGPITADLWVKTTGADADFVVQLIDESPADGGEPLQMMVRGEIMRGKFRSSWEKPQPFKPGVPARVKFDLNDALHTFKKGHRIVVRIQSAWFPIADRNPNTFVSRAAAKDSDFKKATITILTGGSKASRLEVGVLPAP